MRLLFTFLLSMIFLLPKAQVHFPAGTGSGLMPPWQPFTPFSLMLNGDGSRTFHLRPYTGVSAGYLFLGGGGISYLSAPVGVLLYRPLNNNVTAFASASVAPTVFTISRLYNAPFSANNFTGNNFTGLSVNPSIQGGLMYTNDARTFSISGSISVERSSYPVYVPTRSGSSQK